MATGFNGLNDISVTGLVNIEADSVASGVIIASEIIVDGVNITDLIDQLENEIDTNAQNIAQLQADVATLQTEVATLQTEVADLETDVTYLQNNVGYKNANNIWTGVNNFNNNVEITGPALTISNATQTNINGSLSISDDLFVIGDNVVFANANPCQFTVSIPQCSLLPVASNDLANKNYVDSAVGSASILGLNNTWTGTNQFTKTTNVTTNFGSSSNIPFYVSDSSANQNVSIIPNAVGGNYNPSTNNGDCLVFGRNNAVNTNTLSLTTWSQTYSSLRIMPTAILLGAGGFQQSTPTSYVLCDGTGLYANAPFYVFGTALPTCTAALPSLLDSSTKMPTTQWVQNLLTSRIPFVPRFYNYRVEMPSNVAYTQGLRIDFNGIWTARDYFIISVRAQNNYAGSSPWPPNEWQGYATAAGEIIFRPYYTPLGAWGTNTPYNYWPTNNGTIFGNVQKFMYTTNATLNGSNLFIAAGNGTTSGVNASGYVNLRGSNYGGFGNPWVYTCSVEYISISQDTQGSGHVFFTATPQDGGINQYLS